MIQFKINVKIAVNNVKSVQELQLIVVKKDFIYLDRNVYNVVINAFNAQKTQIIVLNAEEIEELVMEVYKYLVVLVKMV